MNQPQYTYISSLLDLPPISHPSHPSRLSQSIGLSSQSAAELLYKPWEKEEKKNHDKEINRASTLVPFLLSIGIFFFLLRYESLGQAPLACSAYLGWSFGQPNPLDACPHLTPEGWLLAPLLLDFWIAHFAPVVTSLGFWLLEITDVQHSDLQCDFILTFNSLSCSRALLAPMPWVTADGKGFCG